MDAIKIAAPMPASRSGSFLTQNAGQPGTLAHSLPQNGFGRRIRHYTPKEAAAALADAGIPAAAKAIRRRCRLPASDPRHIATNPAFPGRFHIPETELARLLGARKAAA
jgi:hypothetical protein